MIVTKAIFWSVKTAQFLRILLPSDCAFMNFRVSKAFAIEWSNSFIVLKLIFENNECSDSTHFPSIGKFMAFMVNCSSQYFNKMRLPSRAPVWQSFRICGRSQDPGPCKHCSCYTKLLNTKGTGTHSTPLLATQFAGYTDHWVSLFIWSLTQYSY